MPTRASGLRELAPRFDAFFVDVWGVLHHGDGPFDGVVGALEGLAAAGREVVLLTNTSRLGNAVAATLGGMGIDRALFHDVVTAGDVTRAALALRAPPLPRAPRCYHYGAASFVPWLFALDLAFTDDVADADLVVATGAVADDAELDAARAHLASAAARKVPLVCTNPDRVIPTAGGPKLGPGAVAHAYAELGGPIFLYGKPYAPIYAEARRRIDATRILALGDTLETDVRGARDAGLPSALVARSGVHAGVAPSALDALFEREHVTPDFVLDRFVW
ncbi:MAG: TIGR01459 family HAD-type hydrolase [Labilithrix sp.]|nr:TIGR01459 family HAD-type hydrolase [Labilithrix sp.]MCW5813128.1 TIGR01459 family HAD-type hydrolase [Labilithrix sp.]